MGRVVADLSPADLVSLHESANRPFAGYSPPGSPPVDLSSAPLDATGFPIWEGRQGPAGISHGAGLFQFEPKTWRPVAQALGVTDFSPESQRKVFDAVYAKQGYAPWAPYNSTLAKAVDWTGPTGSRSQTEAIASAGLLGGATGPMSPLQLAAPSAPAAAPSSATTAPAPAASPNLGPLLALGLAAPKHSFQPVDYDPFKIEKNSETSSDRKRVV